MGTLVWGPLGQGLLTGRVRKNQGNDLRRVGLFQHLNDERRLDAVEKLIPLAVEAGLPMTHLAIAFTIAHPGVTSALIGVRTMDHLDGRWCEAAGMTAHGPSGGHGGQTGANGIDR